MEKAKFKIYKICAGWFEMELSAGENKGVLAASYIFNNDSPKSLLKVISECLREKECNKFVVLNDEPGTYIIFISKSEKVNLYVFSSEVDIREAGIIKECGDSSLEELMSALPVRSEYINSEIDLEFFARSIYKEFKKYSDGKNLRKYEREWMKFPRAEFDELESIINKF